jgi:simple sugar transport system ATP-binding protein
MIFISHALEEALLYADRITVLRNGRLMKTGPASAFDRDSLIRHMIGDDLKARQPAPRGVRAARSALPVLRVENIRWGSVVNNMSFSIFPGEITGIAGLIGSGRSEVAKVIMGHSKRNFGGGKIWLEGREIRYRAPSQAVEAGIAYVTEDRKLEGLFDMMTVQDNGWRNSRETPSLRRLRRCGRSRASGKNASRSVASAMTRRCCISLAATSRRSCSQNPWRRNRSW